MKCNILHESPNRLRVHLHCARMSLHEADLLEYYLRSVDGVTEVTVYDRTQDAVVRYTGQRSAVIGALASFSFAKAEAMELVESGYGNVVCAQPFGCLPNHIVGKGMIRKVKNLYPQANIVPIDYDPSATQVNQENRIKLMLAVAKENLRDQEEAAPKASAAPAHA